MNRTVEPNARVSIDLAWDKLLELMQSGALCGADIHVSDPESKALIQQACLKSCVQKVCAGCEMSDLCGVETCPSGQPMGKQVVTTHPFNL